MIKEIPTIFPVVTKREEKLSKIIRYNLYSPMYYRSSILDHSKRVWLITKTLEPFTQKAFKNLDIKKLGLLALVHDDIEIIIGDIQAGNKSKMSKSQKKELYDQEKKAVLALSKIFPKSVNGYNYQKLLESATKIDCRESEIIQYFDKLDAFGEALHEIYAGNKEFVTNIINQYGKVPHPIEYYLDYFKNFLNKYPKMKAFFQTNPPIPLIPQEVNYIKIIQSSKLHTKKSIQNTTGYIHYDFWKNIILEHPDIIPKKYLYTQVER